MNTDQDADWVPVEPEDIRPGDRVRYRTPIIRFARCPMTVVATDDRSVYGRVCSRSNIPLALWLEGRSWERYER